MRQNRPSYVDVLFARSANLSTEQRRRFLDRKCGANLELRAEVEGLLSSSRQADKDGFLCSSIVPIEGRVADAAAESILGRYIGPYRVVRCIGSGGMGVVYEAVRADKEFDRRVAIKVLSYVHSGVLERFFLEREILARLQHPYIAGLLDAGHDDAAGPYVIMELVDGIPLDEFCDRRKWTIRKRLELLVKVCESIHHAHQHMIVHRDLKPSNILVTGIGVPKLLDFGIAKILRPRRFPRQPASTVGGLRPMSRLYASPEQIRGRRVTTATDVYSMGVVAYEVLTGRLPYAASIDSAYEVERSIVEHPPISPSRAWAARGAPDSPARPHRQDVAARLRSTSSSGLRRTLAGDLDAILLKALEKDPSCRYASILEFTADIRRHLAGTPVTARRNTLRYRTQKFLRRHRAGSLWAASSAAALVVLAVTEASNQRERVQLERQVALESEIHALRTAIDLVQLQYVAGARDRGLEQHLDGLVVQMEDTLRDRPDLQVLTDVPIIRSYYSLGELGRARRQLRLHQRRLEDLAPSVPRETSARALRWEGILAREAGRLAEAEELLRGSLVMFQQVAGGQSHEVVQAMKDLTTVLITQEKYEEALDFLDTADGMILSTPSLVNVGPLQHVLQYHRTKLLLERGLYDSAEEVGQNVLESLGTLQLPVRIAGPCVESLLAEAAWGRGDLETAELLARRSADVLGVLVGLERDNRLALAYKRLARILRSTGPSAYEEADSAIEYALSKLPFESPERSDVFLERGLLFLAAGRFSQAEPWLRKAHELRSGFLPLGGWREAQAEMALGISLEGLGYVDGRARMTAGYRSLVAHLGREDPRVHELSSMARESAGLN